MLLNHIRKLYNDTQCVSSRFNPEKYMENLELKNDLSFAIFMIKLLSPKIKFMKIKDYIDQNNIVIQSTRGSDGKTTDIYTIDVNPNTDERTRRKQGTMIPMGDDESPKYLQTIRKYTPPHHHIGTMTGHWTIVDTWKGHITFSGIDDLQDSSNKDKWQGPSPNKLRFYLQKTLLDDIAKEFLEENIKPTFAYAAAGLPPPSPSTKVLNELLNTIIDKINSKEKLDILLNSIKDVIFEDLI